MPTISTQITGKGETPTFKNEDVLVKIENIIQIPEGLIQSYIEFLVGLQDAHMYRNNPKIAFSHLTEVVKKQGIGYIQIYGESVILGFEVEDKVPSLNLVDATQLEKSITKELFKDDENLYALTISLEDYVNTKGDAGPQTLILLKVPEGDLGMNDEFFKLLVDYAENLEQRY